MTTCWSVGVRILGEMTPEGLLEFIGEGVTVVQLELVEITTAWHWPDAKSQVPRLQSSDKCEHTFSLHRLLQQSLSTPLPSSHSSLSCLIPSPQKAIWHVRPWTLDNNEYYLRTRGVQSGVVALLPQRHWLPQPQKPTPWQSLGHEDCGPPLHIRGVTRFITVCNSA